MNFITHALALGIVLLTIISAHKRWCNAINELTYSYRYSIDEQPVVTQHWEERHADIVHGSYSFLDPNGDVRIVEYQVNGKEGFKAVVHYRKPRGFPLLGHLKYPKYYKHPIAFVGPVSLITNDLFKKRRTYPNLPDK